MSKAKDSTELEPLKGGVGGGEPPGNTVAPTTGNKMKTSAEIAAILTERLGKRGLDRLRDVESARKSSELFYRCSGKLGKSRNGVTTLPTQPNGGDVVERLSTSRNTDEILYIMKHFDESLCEHNVYGRGACAICGLKIDAYDLETNNDDVDGAGVEDDEDNENNNCHLQSTGEHHDSVDDSTVAARSQQERNWQPRIIPEAARIGQEVAREGGSCVETSDRSSTASFDASAEAGHYSEKLPHTRRLPVQPRRTTVPVFHEQQRQLSSYENDGPSSDDDDDLPTTNHVQRDAIHRGPRQSQTATVPRNDDDDAANQRQPHSSVTSAEKNDKGVQCSLALSTPEDRQTSPYRPPIMKALHEGIVPVKSCSHYATDSRDNVRRTSDDEPDSYTDHEDGRHSTLDRRASEDEIQAAGRPQSGQHHETTVLPFGHANRHSMAMSCMPTFPVPKSTIDSNMSFDDVTDVECQPSQIASCSGRPTFTMPKRQSPESPRRFVELQELPPQRDGIIPDKSYSHFAADSRDVCRVSDDEQDSCTDYEDEVNEIRLAGRTQSGEHPEITNVFGHAGRNRDEFMSCMPTFPLPKPTHNVIGSNMSSAAMGQPQEACPMRAMSDGRPTFEVPIRESPESPHRFDGLQGLPPRETVDVHSSGLPTTTFGALLIPRRFMGTASNLDQPCYKRYIRCHDGPDVAKYMFSLLTKHWNIMYPSVILSVVGGRQVTDVNEQWNRFMSSVIQQLVDVTGAWIITDGRNDGASRYLGQLLVERRPADTDNDDDDGEQSRSKPVLLGVSHWGSIERKELMLGVTLPAVDHASKYFLSLEHRIANYWDESRQSGRQSYVLNPFQSAYVFVDNGKKQPENCVEDFCQMLVGWKKSDIVAATIVLGGDQTQFETIIKQVHGAIDANRPVIVFEEGSFATNVIASLYRVLEDKVRRSSSKSIAQLTSEELAVLERAILRCRYDDLLGNLSGRMIRGIMEKRYLMTVVDCEQRDKEQPHGEEDACIRILRSCYRDTSRSESVLAALKSCRPEFLQATFCQNEDECELEKQEIDGNVMTGDEENIKRFITISDLHILQLGNMAADDSMKKTLVFAYKRLTFSKKEQDVPNILPIMGRFVHLLMGPRFRILYHDKQFIEFAYKLEEDMALGGKYREAFHLMLWSILGNKPALTHFFILQTSAPLGATLVASMLYSRLARWAKAIFEGELRDSLKQSAEYFETMAIDIMVRMYDKDPEDAYRVLICELPFDLGPYVTPLVVADDAKAMKFLSHDCCQTFLQRVWKGNMAEDTQWWRMLPAFFLTPCLVIPRIYFYDSSLSKPQDESRYELNEDCTEKCKDPVEEDPPVSYWKKLEYYHEAPITKYFTGMLFYVCYLGLLSYYVLTDLRPFTAWSDITVVEWILIVWIASLLIEEIVQIFSPHSTGPLHDIPPKNLSMSVWHRKEKIFAKFWWLDVYFRGGRWNALDTVIGLLFVIAFALRFTLPPNAFQIDRVLFAVTVICCYFRLLWYWFLLKSIGPLIIAIQMMMTELLKFLLLLAVFIVSFGVAFQAILHPNQKPSGTTLVDILWRPFWQMFGEIYLDDESGGMGRDVSDTSCAARTAELVQVATSTNEHLDGVYCVEWAAPVLLGIYLLIANVLLLNLLIAIFSKAYETVKETSETVYKFNLYGLIQECYYQTVLPPPLSLLERFKQLVCILICRCRCNHLPPTDKYVIDSFRLTAVNSAIQRRACRNIKPYNVRNKKRSRGDKTGDD